MQAEEGTGLQHPVAPVPAGVGPQCARDAGTLAANAPVGEWGEPARGRSSALCEPQSLEMKRSLLFRRALRLSTDPPQGL